MTYYSVSNPYVLFFDDDGAPLENGYIYIGEVNQNPITNPLNVSWDVSGLYPAAQPVRTIAGYPSRNGSPGRIFVNSLESDSYSILIQDKNQEFVYSSLDAVADGFVFRTNADTIADLRAVTYFEIPIYVRGHTTIGDGGQGNFEWFDGQPAGTYVDDDGITIVPTGGDGSGAWIRAFNGAVYGAWFGMSIATADNSTLAETVIASAATKGSSVVFEYFYPIENQIDVTDDDVKIRFENNGGFTVGAASTQTRIFNIAADNVSVIGGTFFGNNTLVASNVYGFIATGDNLRINENIIYDTYSAINFHDSASNSWACDNRIYDCGQDGIESVTGCNNIHCERNKIYNFTRSGITADGTPGLEANYIFIKNNQIDGNNNGNSRGVDIEDADHIFIEENTFINMVNDGAFVGNSTDVVEVKNNYIKTTGATGIFARGSNVKLVGNNIEDAGTEGIWADGSAGSDAPNCMIADNTVLNSGSYGIFLNAATQYCKIDNNIVKASQSSGIGVFNTPDVTITNNTCMNNNQAASATVRNASGIALYDGTDPCDNCVITGNRCGDDQGVKTQLYGVSETGSSTGFVVVGNNLFGNATAAFSGNAGDGTVASNFP